MSANIFSIWIVLTCMCLDYKTMQGLLKPEPIHNIFRESNNILFMTTHHYISLPELKFPGLPLDLPGQQKSTDWLLIGQKRGQWMSVRPDTFSGHRFPPSREGDFSHLPTYFIHSWHTERKLFGCLGDLCGLQLSSAGWLASTMAFPPLLLSPSLVSSFGFITLLPVWQVHLHNTMRNPPLPVFIMTILFPVSSQMEVLISSKAFLFFYVSNTFASTFH